MKDSEREVRAVSEVRSLVSVDFTYSRTARKGGVLEKKAHLSLWSYLAAINTQGKAVF